MRVLLAMLPVFGLGALARAQEAAERTVRPETWPEAGRWSVPAWVVVAVGVSLVLMTLVGLALRLRRRRSRRR